MVYYFKQDTTAASFKIERNCFIAQESTDQRRKRTKNSSGHLHSWKKWAKMEKKEFIYRRDNEMCHTVYCRIYGFPATPQVK